MILFTDPRYDRRISKLFNTTLTEVGSFKKREFAEITLEDNSFKLYSTYHPKKLRLARLEERVINQIASIFKLNEAI